MCLGPAPFERRCPAGKTFNLKNDKCEIKENN